MDTKILTYNSTKVIYKQTIITWKNKVVYTIKKVFGLISQYDRYEKRQFAYLFLENGILTFICNSSIS